MIPAMRAMDIDYDTVSKTYDVHRTGRGPYLAPLVDLARAAKAQVAVEAGAGTGSVTAALREAVPCKVIGIDRSAGMLRQNQAKHPAAPLAMADAAALPLRDGVADFVYSVFMIHHLKELDRFFAECRRVLRKGPLAIVTSTHAFLDAHPMNAYFPSFAAVDKARFQHEDIVAEAMADAGFADVSITVVQSAPQPIDARYVDKVANRFISTYDLLPPAEFDTGLQRLRADVQKNGQLDKPLVWEAAVIHGWRK